MKNIIISLLFTSFLFTSELLLTMSSNPSRINPILSTDSASSIISGWIFNGLFKYDKDGNIVGDLAESWYFEDNITLIIKIKKNILWHDGEEFDSNDIIFTYNTIHSPTIHSPYTTLFTKVQKVENPDKYTLKITYKSPYYKALHIWMMGFLPEHLLKNEKDIMTSSFNKNPIGTGSYKLKNFKPNEDVILSINENYFDKKPKIKTIRYKYVPDATVEFNLLKLNKIDLGGLNPLQIDRQLDDSFTNNFNIYEKPATSYTYLGLNLKTEKFKNPKLRQAINLAINKKELIDILFFKHGKITNGPFLPGTFAFNPHIKTQYNPQKAKQILSSLGFNKNNPFTFTVVTNTNNDTRINATQIIQHQLKKIGIEMKIKIMEWQAFLNTIVLPKNFEAVMLGWSMSLMPDARSIWHSTSYKKGGFNFIGYSNTIVDRNIELAEQTTDFKKLTQLYQEIYKEIANDNPYIFLYIPNSITAVNKNIKNVSQSIIGITHNRHDWIKE
jgi:peptide/nickel transport system substrate-binding protein